ncbi:MAG TPA: xanthine phosphoribosyltransferase [Clostridiales bacterium]|nr:xanthine phosphoribosyltransferase [Clostridiales bacterium]
MKELEEKINAEGIVAEGNILKVSSFLNHKIDVPFMNEVGKEFYRLFQNDRVTKILTIEASGIGIACLTAQYFNVPVVFAKKSKSKNLTDDVYATEIASFTHKNTNQVIVEKRFIQPEDRILIIDDFLAKGNALKGLIQLTQDAGATVVGAGIVIEKAYQDGGKLIRDTGVRVESLARIASMSPETGCVFLHD